ncbi:hypothetical protein QYF36_005905 [Acer negundo]|nr:hypothetical protein QYF36_005905 [Acer negundo]
MISLQLCRFCTDSDLNFHENLAGLLAFRLREPVSIKCYSADEPPADPLSLGDIIENLKENGNEYTWGDVMVKLAKAYGFSWGFEQAVRIAFEARKQFPKERIWITNQIIHNPTDYEHLEEMEVQNIPIDEGKKQFDVVDR